MRVIAFATVKNKGSDTPSDLAKQCGYKNIVGLLRKCAKEPRELDKNTKEENIKKLFSVLDSCNLQLAEQLIEQGVDINDKNQKGYTPLHFSVHKGYKNIIELFLNNKKADVNARSGGDFTPLHLAVQEGKSDIVELFLGKGVDVNSKNKKGFTPSYLAEQEGHKDVAEFRLKYTKENST